VQKPYKATETVMNDMSERAARRNTDAGRN